MEFQMRCSRTGKTVRNILSEDFIQGRIRDIVRGKQNSDYMACGCNMSYSGTLNEGENREHFQKLMHFYKSKGSPGTNAIVLGCGAGYGCFYLALNKFQGNIVGEDWDPNSIAVASMIGDYFGHEDVLDSFSSQGLKAATNLIIQKMRIGTSPRPYLGANFKFILHNSTQDREDKLAPYGLIICDNIHTEEIVGEKGITDMCLRISSISKKGTLLSYRHGGRADLIKRLGFNAETASIFVKI